MAFDAVANSPGLPHDGVRRLDHIQTSVRGQPKRLLADSRSRVHGSGRKVRDNYDLVRSWAIVAVASPAAGAALTVIATRSHW